MPASEKSPSVSAKCTALRPPLEVTGMHIATSGDRCALHLYSRAGTTVALMPLALFVEKARADADGNGRPFPLRKQERRSTTRDLLERDAEASRERKAESEEQSAKSEGQGAAGEGQSGRTLGSSPLALGRPISDRPRRYTPRAEHQRRCLAAWEAIVADPARKVSDVAAEHDITPEALSKWILAHRPDAWRVLRPIHFALLRGRPLTPTQAVLIGAPLTKPNGSL